jgi:hypothetical protein
MKRILPFLLSIFLIFCNIAESIGTPASALNRGSYGRHTEYCVQWNEEALGVTALSSLQRILSHEHLWVQLLDLFPDLRDSRSVEGVQEYFKKRRLVIPVERILDSSDDQDTSAQTPAPVAITFPDPIPSAKHPWNERRFGHAMAIEQFSVLDRHDHEIDEFGSQILPLIMERHKHRQKARFVVVGPGTGEELATVGTEVLARLGEGYPGWDISIIGIERDAGAVQEGLARLSGHSPLTIEERYIHPRGIYQLRSDYELRVQKVMKALRANSKWFINSCQIQQGDAAATKEFDAFQDADVIFINDSLGSDPYYIVRDIRLFEAITKFAPHSFVLSTNTALLKHLVTHRIENRTGDYTRKPYGVAIPAWAIDAYPKVAPSNRFSADKAETNGRSIIFEMGVTVSLEFPLMRGQVLGQLNHFAHLAQELQEAFIRSGFAVNESVVFEIYKIFAHLVPNAVDAIAETMSGGGQIYLTIVKDGSQLILAIEDTGIGISVATLERLLIWQTSTKRKIPWTIGGNGTGLLEMLAHAKRLHFERIETATRSKSENTGYQKVYTNKSESQSTEIERFSEGTLWKIIFPAESLNSIPYKESSLREGISTTLDTPRGRSITLDLTTAA